MRCGAKPFLTGGILLLAVTLASGVDWRIGDDVYREVTVKEVTARAVIIQHSHGITQILLADLPPEAQEAFGFDPQAALAESQRLEREGSLARAQRDDTQTVLAADDEDAAMSPVAQLRARLDEPAQIKAEVDLRPRLRELGLFSKSQGRRPSCSVFAVVGALEIQSAQSGKPTQFSEDYAIWATRQYLAGSDRVLPEAFAEGDAGFRLIDVVQALAQFGLVNREQMPNTFGTGMDRIEPPETELLEQARRELELKSWRIDLRDSKQSINRLTQALNAGQPVVIGVGWPHENTLQAAPMISGQNPVSLHAVTLVGYRSDKGGENHRFVFKNSWGPEWGSGGYGWITADYLAEHLASAYLLDPKFR